MTVEDIMQIIESKIPADRALDWDNVGLLVGDRASKVNKIYLALDATDEVIDHAIGSGADLLLTHHPMIFSGIKSVTEDTFLGRRIRRLIRSGISCYAMHTNFDICVMADLAAEKLGLAETQVLEECGCDFVESEQGTGAPKLESSCETVECEKETGAQSECGCEQKTDAKKSECGCEQKPYGIGCVGELTEPLTLEQLAQKTTKDFGISHVKVFGDRQRLVKRVAMCPGSGKSDISFAIKKGADAYITGDIDHHSGIDAVADGLAVIDAGHYGLEHIYMEYMRGFIEEHFTGILVEAEPFMEPFWICN